MGNLLPPPTRKIRYRWLALPVVALVAVPALALKTDLLLSELDVGPIGAEGAVDEWMAKVSEVHGPRTAWIDQGEVELTCRGELAFLPLRAMFGTALTEPTVELTLTFRPDTHGPYRYSLRQGDSVRTGTVDNRDGRGKLGFMFDSVRHLFEAPWSVSEVPFRRGLTARDDGREGVFLTWGEDAEPTRRHDQVAMWAKNGTIVTMDTTGRDVAPFIVARVDYEGEVRLGELRMHRSASVVDTKGKVVHRWELLAVKGAVGR